MPAADSDIDHTKAYAEGGASTDDNLATLCRHDHCIRHMGWTYKPVPGGRYQWTSRLGHTYTTTRAPP
ncbi:MAG: HNH endonuclease [Actinomycetota bacterium]|nr:HNH endonuclease [Actinomycetota bacterium]